MRDIMGELAIIANSKASDADIERVELKSIDVMIAGSADDRFIARIVLMMASEIRRSRGTYDNKALTNEQIADEVAILRGRS